jgi:competence/damage-inducible protein CinA-like protein
VTLPRAVVLVTGSELVRGHRQDLNGPFLARELLARGLEPAEVKIVGDRPDELERALREGLEGDLLVISGGLGPTHDDRTVELLAQAAGRSLAVDLGLEEDIGSISRPLAERLGRPYSDFEGGVRKQASLPEGALVLGIAGTAPGIVLDTGSCVAVALPGPPAELQRLWGAAVESEPVRRVLERAGVREHRVLRFFGASESTIAAALAEAGGEVHGVEATVCARDLEIHVDLFADEDAVGRADELATRLRELAGEYLFAEDELSVEERVLAECRNRGLTLAAAESCTGGLVSARLTGIPGSSDVFVGGVVAYANEVKAAELGVPEDILASHGAVSAEAAAAMTGRVRARLGADVGVAVTGIAGPGGGTAEKPVGLVYLHAQGPDGDLATDYNFRGDRETVRQRATVAALHLVRRLLSQSRHDSA